MSHVSDIKLIRTDTTLDLSQKAEKGMLCNGFSTPFYSIHLGEQASCSHTMGYVLHSIKLANETVKAFIDFNWRGAPGPSSSATQGRRSRTPIASYCDGPFPLKNKFNIISYKLRTGFWRGAPGPCSSATQGRHARTPIASYCHGLSP
ncbi:unnamed protein product, partial [Vitis vinifera]